jgi:hypothetical protein
LQCGNVANILLPQYAARFRETWATALRAARETNSRSIAFAPAFMNVVVRPS